LSRCSSGMGGPYPAIRPAERGPSKRPDNPVRAGPDAPPLSFFASYYKLQFAVGRKHHERTHATDRGQGVRGEGGKL